ncbi:MAG: leucine-rich repeat protein [Oscillospiraceae bacterium]|nr:leucine-rich repeat protein [Oscillospiraceae bacterium]
MKRILPFALALCLCLALLPGTASAASSGQCGGNVYWTLDDSGTLTISGTGPMWNWVMINNNQAYMAPWYSLIDRINTVNIANGVTTIGEYAFFYCTSLTSVTIPDGVTTIGDNAFVYCTSLTSVTIPDSVTTIGENAFISCDSLTSVTIPNSVTTIGEGAFSLCDSLTSVTIPNSVTTIGINAFWVCDNLTIYCYSGSYANRYAIMFKIPYVLIMDGTNPTPKPELTAKPTASTVLVNGETVAFDAYHISDNNYFKLRDIAYILSGSEKQFEVTWDGAAQKILLASGKPYTPVGGEMLGKGEGTKTPMVTTSKVILNGKEVSLTAYHIENNNYFMLRDIGQLFDFEVDWDGANQTIIIDTSKGYTPD